MRTNEIRKDKIKAKPGELTATTKIMALQANQNPLSGSQSSAITELDKYMERNKRQDETKFIYRPG